jgi:hypothetical protein
MDEILASTTTPQLILFSLHEVRMRTVFRRRLQPRPEQSHHRLLFSHLGALGELQWSLPEALHPLPLTGSCLTAMMKSTILIATPLPSIVCLPQGRHLYLQSDV